MFVLAFGYRTKPLQSIHNPKDEPVKNSDNKTILMTAFEPSGDALGAMAARGVFARNDSVRIVGLGGKEMEEAGVELLAYTSDEAAMGLHALTEVMRVKRLVDNVKHWLTDNKASLHVAVDSPAANFPVCKVARSHSMNVVHLAAPQMWAWAPWRIKKLKRLTDHVMCLLPFEPSWFNERGVEATFIGHPAMATSETSPLKLKGDSPKVLILPGSRASEIKANLPMQLGIFDLLKKEFPAASACIACREEDVFRVQPISGEVPIIKNQLHEALEWADVALTTSGTVSLHVMQHAVPMVGMYKVGLISRIGARLILNTPYRLLPNLIAGKKVVPEFIPCGDATHAITSSVVQLLRDPSALEMQRRILSHEASQYSAHHPSDEAAAIILKYV